MGSTLRQARTDAAGALTAGGVPAWGYMPERITPPAGIVFPDEPYVSDDDASMCGTYRANLRLTLLVPKASNERAADELDELIVQAVAVLDVAPWELAESAVAEPVELELNGATYLGTIIRFSTLTTMELLP